MTLASHQTFKMHRALCMPCNAGCISEVLHGSNKKYLPGFGADISPFGLGEGEAQKTLPSLSLPPSIYPSRRGFERACFATKVQNTSPDLHALGRFGRRMSSSPCKRLDFNCTLRKAQLGDFCKRSAKETSAGTYMMGQG